MAQAPGPIESIIAATKKVNVVLGVTVYLKVALPRVADQVTSALNTFLARAEPLLRWYADEKIGRIRRSTPEHLRYPARWIRQPGAGERVFAWIMFGAEDKNDAPVCSFDAFSTVQAPDAEFAGGRSYLRFTFPVGMFFDDLTKFAAMVNELLTDLPVHYGYGGYFFSESENDGQQQINSRIVYAAAMRFQGVEVDRVITTKVSIFDCIKGVNWLTLIDDDFVARLGGLAALEQRLPPGIVLHRRPNGIILQAGPAPSIGDLNAGDTLPHYREVARLLKPIRTKTHPPLGHAAFGSFGDRGTQEWLRRFDD